MDAKKKKSASKTASKSAKKPEGKLKKIKKADLMKMRGGGDEWCAPDRCN